MSLQMAPCLFACIHSVAQSTAALHMVDEHLAFSWVQNVSVFKGCLSVL